jgi:hypothetical protein
MGLKRVRDRRWEEKDHLRVLNAAKKLTLIILVIVLYV